MGQKFVGVITVWSEANEVGVHRNILKTSLKKEDFELKNLQIHVKELSFWSNHYLSLT